MPGLTREMLVPSWPLSLRVWRVVSPHDVAYRRWRPLGSVPVSVDTARARHPKKKAQREKALYVPSTTVQLSEISAYGCLQLGMVGSQRQWRCQCVVVDRVADGGRRHRQRYAGVRSRLWSCSVVCFHGSRVWRAGLGRRSQPSFQFRPPTKSRVAVRCSVFFFITRVTTKWMNPPANIER